MKKLLLSFFVLTVCFSGFSQTKFIPAGNKAFRYVGRYESSNPNEIRFDWTGFYILFSFRGTSCALRMNDSGHNYYTVYLDNKAARTIEVKSDTTVQIAAGLETQVHQVQIVKRTEGSQGMGSFKGILISEKGEMIALKDIPTRRIEFIGNSITCGYGTEGLSKNEHWKPSTENSSQSYATIMARALQADYHLVAHSGQGVVRNYGYKDKISPLAMPGRFNRVFDEKELPLWDFRKWKPDVVVVNLGTNDFSTQPFPDKADFKKGYEKLIREVFKQYGELPVFCLVGPMTDEPCYSYVKEIVEDLRSVYQKKNVFFVGIPTYLMSDNDLGSDSHPNYLGQKKMAAHVLPVISSVTGWKFQENELKY